ncbi:MAG: fatty acid oxidation complex subunit alpha FadB [Pseudomonadales bacterium]
MIYQGQTITVEGQPGGVAELSFNNQTASVNKFDQATVTELGQATAAIAASDAIAVLVSSAKPVFIVGADINEFGKLRESSEEGIIEHLVGTNAVFTAFEDLDVPKVVAINGFALGGGFELCLTCEYRIAAEHAKVGLPEVSLGLFPGFGGTVRLPRVIGFDNAVQWIATGKEQRSNDALKVGAIDSVVAVDKLRDAALRVIEQCLAGDLDWRARREEKMNPLPLNGLEMIMSATTAKGMVAQQAGRNMPAPMASVKLMERAAGMGRDEALVAEHHGFAAIICTPQAVAMSGLFLSDQYIGKQAQTWAKQASPVKLAAVLGAGIMGGGIAYQSAYKGTPIVMKDINDDGIQLGLSEANSLLAKRVSRGRMTPKQMGETLNRINPTLSYDDLKGVDMVVEAVVENPKVKHIVLAEVEEILDDTAILSSNTSTISINYLAECLKRPENFCGMHFFNPVHAMPLVEVIRGEKTSDAAVAKTTAYALALGKKPIVINDCPGFLVNRVLFPYFAGFMGLLKLGADFQAVDKVMEKWGWPMGPAYLQDVIGLDTGVHAAGVLADGFPDRMSQTFKDATTALFEAGRLGQKNAKGFYQYVPDKRGKIKKTVDPEAYELIKPHVGESREFSEQEIIERMMVPMCTEIARCLEEGVVASVAEADMALIYGVGFPVFRGGVFRWMDSVGIAAVVEMADKYAAEAAVYAPTEKMREMAAANATYY